MKDFIYMNLMDILLMIDFSIYEYVFIMKKPDFSIKTIFRRQKSVKKRCLEIDEKVFEKGKENRLNS